MILPDCTLTTCCFDTSKFNNGALTIQSCIDRIDCVLQLPVYLIVYTEQTFVDVIRQKREEYGFSEYTIIVETRFEDIWSYAYLEKVKRNREICYKTRDARTCAESHIITCNKFDFVLKTISKNPFNTSKFAWIDAFLGINNKLRICENYTLDIMMNLLNNINDKFHIQIMNVNDKKYKLDENKDEYYSQYRYVVCGGFFTCGREIGIKVLTRLNDNFIRTTELGYGHGEEMLYLEILDEFYNDIERSYGDYGQIINNFINPTTNIRYLYYFIIKRYQDFQYYKECYECCKKTLYSIENLNIQCTPELYMNILFSYYLSSYYHKQSETVTILNHIFNIIHTNPAVEYEYNRNKGFYDSQFIHGHNLKPHYSLVIHIFACATNEKYKNEIVKINETWGKLAEEKGVKVLYFLGEEQTDLLDNNKYIYLKDVKNDYESAFHKQNLGFKYIYENYNADFVFCCGTDTFVNIEKMLIYITQFDKNRKLYIGGHGTTRNINNRDIYFHSGGAGFLLSNGAISALYPLFENMQDRWVKICNISSTLNLSWACDVAIAYYLQDLNTVIVINNDAFFGCNYKGWVHDYTYNCCSSKIKIENIITCHSMSLPDFDDFNKILKNKIIDNVKY